MGKQHWQIQQVGLLTIENIFPSQFYINLLTAAACQHLLLMTHGTEVIK